MKKEKSFNYLRTYRRRLGLTQGDVAFLLGTLCRSRVARHEKGECLPPSDVILAYEIIFGVVAGDTYEDDIKGIKLQVKKQAKKLHESLEHRPRDPWRKHKCVVLQQLIERLSS